MVRTNRDIFSNQIRKKSLSQKGNYANKTRNKLFVTFLYQVNEPCDSRVNHIVLIIHFLEFISQHSITRGGFATVSDFKVRLSDVLYSGLE